MSFCFDFLDPSSTSSSNGNDNNQLEKGPDMPEADPADVENSRNETGSPVCKRKKVETKNKFFRKTPTSDGCSEVEASKLNRESHCLPSKEIIPTSTDLEMSSTDDKFQKNSLELSNGTQILYVDSATVEGELMISSTSKELETALKNNTDLIPNVYEGGLKIWECSLDLVHYLHSLEIDWKEKKVLEIGCGAGLPGIFALIQGSQVDFQDYNEEVLHMITIPNVQLNKQEALSGGNEEQKSRYFCGDWGGMSELLGYQNKKYDIILASETIYNLDSYEKQHKLMDNLLTEIGVVYIAAKTYYFGVKGGVREFEELIKKKDVFEISVCKEFKTGVQREILKVTRKR